jgi:hypothetical protein
LVLDQSTTLSYIIINELTPLVSGGGLPQTLCMLPTLSKMVSGNLMTDDKVHKRQFVCLLVVLVALVVSDGLISQFLIRGGLGSEGNPFLMNWVNEPGFIAIKAAGALLCALILWDIYKHWSKLATVISAVFVAVYSAILFWNISVFVVSQL